MEYHLSVITLHFKDYKQAGIYAQLNNKKLITFLVSL